MRDLFSTRSDFDPEPNELSRLLDARGSSGLLDLTEANPTAAGIPYDGEAIREAIAPESILRYEPDAFGHPAARAAVAAELGRRGRPIDPSDLVLTASTSEAYSYLFKLLCDPGDAVAVPEPSYPLFEHLARFEGVRLAPYRLAYDGAWHTEMGDLARAVRSTEHGAVRAVLVVSPNNPTGHFTRRAEYEAIAALGLPIVADEVFADYPLAEASPFVSVRSQASALVFALSGLSKLAALPQMKLGWIEVGGAPPARAEALRRLELIADSFLSVGTPVQRGVGGILEASRVSSDAIAARVRENYARLGSLIRSAPAATLLTVEGGWYAVLRLPSIVEEDGWVRRFLEADVKTQPGAFFDFHRAVPGVYVVLSLLTEPHVFAEGLRRIVRTVSTVAGGT